ncbi:MAG: dienelactone hydrolase family protein [Gloeomargaritaceae cyanobacterium C42_A2020_066]|nr:dienelactone hydrolase family protein [Gloeomargaritaceae cyanobacterium C42_A2020_066]
MAEITLTLPAGRCGAYLAEPAGRPWPGLVLIQEIFGVEAVMRRTADFFAAQGYGVLVPDLFWRLAPGVQLDPTVPADLARAFELYQALDVDAALGDLEVAIEALAGRPGCSGIVGTVGFCLGGYLAYRMAGRPAGACHVSYYGVGIENHLPPQMTFQSPLLMHIAAQDQFVPLAAQAAIGTALDPEPLVTMHTYPGVDHAFARLGSPAYVPAAAELALARTLEFLSAHLTKTEG